MITFELDGRAVSVAEDSGTLLDALREQLGSRSPKDGCSPQGQCGCCTVLVDGAPRVSCVTPVRRLAGRTVTTLDGLDQETRDRWVAAFVEYGASQCGFCTPGIIVRLSALEARRGPVDRDAVCSALLAHLCRCTGWQSIIEAACSLNEPADVSRPEPAGRDPLLARWRAALEGPTFQSAGPEAVLGRAGFADDTAPADALVAMPGSRGEPVVAPTLAEARVRADKTQGRNSTVALGHPVEVPDGEWAVALRTTWVEPAYLEPDASWCRPGGRPASPLANGGAFGGKRRSAVPDLAAALAHEYGQAVRVRWSREDVVRFGPKRPPIAAGVRADGTGILRVATTASTTGLDTFCARVAAAAPGLVVEPVAVAGPPVSADLRAAGWAEASVLVTVAGALAKGRIGPGTPVSVTGTSGGWASAEVAADGTVSIEVCAGEILDPVTLRSYCLGAVHQALGWVYSEGIAVDDAGAVQDLTIRSFGILAARDTPRVEVTMKTSDRWPVNGSDAVFAATAAAAWLAEGLVPQWPTRGARSGR